MAITNIDPAVVMLNMVMRSVQVELNMQRMSKEIHLFFDSEYILSKIVPIMIRELEKADKEYHNKTFAESIEIDTAVIHFDEHKVVADMQTKEVSQVIKTGFKKRD